MSDLYRIDKERLDSMSDYQKHRVETALGTALHDEVLIPVTDKRLFRVGWEASIDRQAIYDTLIENDGLTYDTVANRIMELFDAAVGEETT